MSRLVKIINNKYVQIEEYRNPNICFNTSEYNDFEDYCTLRETFDPFEIFYENQELKEKLDKYENPRDMTLFAMRCTEKVKDENENLKKKYSSTVADYETAMFEKEQLNSLVNSCQEEIRQLKTQLKNKYKKVGTLTGELLYEENTKLINQQKEFVKCLEDEIKELQKIKETELDYDILKDVMPQLLVFEDVLQKHKSIIGDDK